MKKLSLRGFLTLSILALALPHMAQAQALTDTAKSADLEVTDAKIVYKKDHIDVFFSIKNNGKTDEKLGGADTPLTNAGTVEVIVTKDGKEQEVPVAEDLVAGKTTEFSKDAKWLRIRDVAEPKDSDVIPVALFFRRSPNAKLVLALSPSKAGKTPTHPSDMAGTVANPTVPVPPTPPAAPVAPVATPVATGTTAPVAAAPSGDAAAPKKSSSFLDWFKK